MNKSIFAAVAVAISMTSVVPAQAGLWKVLTGETYKEYAHRTNAERIEKNLTWQWTKDDWKAAAIGVAIVAPIIANPITLSGSGRASCEAAGIVTKAFAAANGFGSADVGKTFCVTSGF